MKKSWLAAGTLIVVLSLWMASGVLKSDKHESADDDRPVPLMTVQVQTMTLESMERTLTLQGELTPVQHLQLQAETSGRLEQILVSRGDRVMQGDPLLQLDAGNRPNMLAEATARVRSARSEKEAAEALQRQRLQSQLQLELAEAALESALAQQRSIELDISHTTISAPFAGVVNALPVERGQLINRGEYVVELIDDGAFDVTARAAQQSVSRLQVGQSLSVELITGETLPGRLTFISSLADPQTRSFEVEARVDNASGELSAGVSATLIIPVERIEAAYITPAALSLGDDGQLGVKVVNEEQRVHFLPIELVSTSLDGAWVTGIPEGAQLITLGQGFVSIGEQVEAQHSESPQQTTTEH